MSHTLLPRELLEAIIDNLHDDLPALKASTLAFRALLHRARSHIFAKIKLLPHSDPVNPVKSFAKFATSCSKFHKLLQSSPHLASYTRQLTVLDGRLHPCLPCLGASAEEQLNGPPWVTEEPTLPAVIGMLDNLESLAFLNQIGPLRSWSSLPHELRVALLRAFRKPTMQRVELQYLAFTSPHELFTLFESCVGLKDLYIISVRTSDVVPQARAPVKNVSLSESDSQDDNMMVVKQPHIEYLKLSTLERSTCPLLSRLANAQSTLNLSRLRALSLPTIHILDLGAVVHLLSGIAPSLEHLSLPTRLSIPAATKPFALDVDLGACKNIRTLEIGISPVQITGIPESSTVLWLVRMLSSASLSRTIESIVLDIFMDLPTAFKPDEWRVFDITLQKLSRLRSLVLRLSSFQPQSLEGVDTLVWNTLSLCRSRGVLSVERVQA